eukprot:6212078-Pleurochrysis_carterae.AAC.2
MIITIVAMAMGAPGLPRSPEQNVDQRSPVNHLFSRTRLLSFRRQSRGCFHSLSCSLMAARASSDALFMTPNFHGVFGSPSFARCRESSICWSMSLSCMGCPCLPGWTFACVAACAIRHLEKRDFPALEASAFSSVSICSISAKVAAARDGSWAYVQPGAMHGRGSSSPGGGMWDST